MTDRAVDLFRAFLAELGHEPGADPELDRTPERFTELMRARFAPRPPPDPAHVLPSEVDARSRIVVRDLPFHAFCAHQVVPFSGRVHIAYRPRRAILGFGAFPALLDTFARRPQLQERLTAELADHLVEILDPIELVVASQARQACMELTTDACGASTDCLVLRGDVTAAFEAFAATLLRPSGP